MIDNSNALGMTDVSDVLHDDRYAVIFVIRNNTYGNRIPRFGRMYGNYLERRHMFKEKHWKHNIKYLLASETCK